MYGYSVLTYIPTEYPVLLYSALLCILCSPEENRLHRAAGHATLQLSVIDMLGIFNIDLVPFSATPVQSPEYS